MSKALDLIQKIEEISYLGQHNDYTEKNYDRDSAEYLSPFSDLQLPDKSGKGLIAQTKHMQRKSKVENGNGNTIK